LEDDSTVQPVSDNQGIGFVAAVRTLPNAIDDDDAESAECSIPGNSLWKPVYGDSENMKRATL